MDFLIKLLPIMLVLIFAAASIPRARPDLNAASKISRLQYRASFPALPKDSSTSMPLLLSETGVFADTLKLTPAPGLLPYEVNAPFWSDGAGKMRWIALPDRDDATVDFKTTGPWKFPPGTVLVKHFEKGNARVETRILIKDNKDSAYGATYRWRPDNSDADLVTEAQIGTLDETSQQYYFPGTRDCHTCHTPQSRSILGVNARQLSLPISDGKNQLSMWSELGMFSSPVSESEIASVTPLSAVDDDRASLEDRARSYLDVNCAMCHQPGGATGNFDARFDTPLLRQNLLNSGVAINMGIDQARVIAPRDPSRSTVLARIRTLDAGTRMPPIGHLTVDKKGADLLERWILTMEGEEVTAPPQIAPSAGSFHSSATIQLSHPDPRAVIYFTTNGLPPTHQSTQYTSPIITTRSVTIRACAIKPGTKKSIAVNSTIILK